MMRIFGLFCGVLLIACLGCTSVKTTPLNRCEGGQLVKNCEKPIKGVPVMLRVPTHLDVKIIQVDYWNPSSTNLVKIDGGIPSRHVETTIKETEKMFFVDPKRVASGNGIYGFTFSSKASNGTETDAGKGYLSGVAYEAVDTTLAESAQLVGNIVGLLGQQTSNEQKMAKDLQVVTTSRTIAYRKFDINSPTIETDVRDFCNAYLNDCHQGCHVPPVYPEPN